MEIRGRFAEIPFSMQNLGEQFSKKIDTTNKSD
jgi:hypothetical protein